MTPATPFSRRTSKAHKGSVDPAYLRKRLVVIAIEDVMLGNLRAVAWTLALAGNQVARRAASDLKAAVWLTRHPGRSTAGVSARLRSSRDSLAQRDLGPRLVGPAFNLRLGPPLSGAR